MLDLNAQAEQAASDLLARCQNAVSPEEQETLRQALRRLIELGLAAPFQETPEALDLLAVQVNSNLAAASAILTTGLIRLESAEQTAQQLVSEKVKQYLFAGLDLLLARVFGLI